MKNVFLKGRKNPAQASAVMSRNGHITKQAEWFRQKVTELGEALERLPEDRRQQFEREKLRQTEENAAH